MKISTRRLSTLIGAQSDRMFEVAQDLYASVNVPIHRCSIETAEVMKLVFNSFHALKVSFANEIGRVCKELGLDAYRVMDLFCKDDKLNLSACYLKPGLPFGGSCLPKDLSALLALAKEHDVPIPMLQAVPQSNKVQVERLVKVITDRSPKTVGLLGLSFKAGTDDLRNSPTADVAERLLEMGYEVLIYEPNLQRGPDKGPVGDRPARFEPFLVNEVEELVRRADLAVISTREKEFVEAVPRFPDTHFIDLVGLAYEEHTGEKNYEGICW